ncbi:acetate--CoA ligase family protein [Streptomyces tsukubensis]|uniref:Carboxylate--amine ligase n=1 Tax=Streptomyces tsukubensis TaxID=83656 RepID=A0A1V4A226_9ACTN|nr:acetate--CoA ligase family protein [Streptomyces tsukubensis]OON72752.1 carboxylate--amine ligase [Streptomyces tsukubensis]QFR96852.1 CoA-binding protein [Streptomyces tsukubensis]
MSTATTPVGTEAMHALFAPGSIALVGATDKSGWSVSTFDNLRASGFSGPVHLVNPRTEVVHGQCAHRSLTEIGEPVDMAYVMVPTTAVLSVLREGAGLGIRSYVVLTAGFGETGPEGLRLEEEILDFARGHGLTVLGPNGNGYINATAGTTPYGLPIPPPLIGGPVGVVLQSGALASSLLGFAQARNVGLSLLTSMGNETMVSVTDVIDYLVDDPATKVIALFVESVRRPREFARVARRAARAGKPIVALKIGSSSLASHTAQAHTGALVGDDAVVDAAFRKLGVVRVRSLEDLIITAGLLAQTGPVRGRRIGVVTPSGGACEVIADRAEQEGLTLPPFAPGTVARLKEILPDFATVQNPLDVTGYVVVDRTLLSRALEVVADDPGVDAVILLSDLPRLPPADLALTLEHFTATARRIREARRPVIVTSNVLTDITEVGRQVQREAGFPYVAGGIEHAMTAIGAAVRWSRTLRESPRPESVAGVGAPVVRAETTGVWAEHRAARLLADNGVPVVPSALAVTEDEAVAAAADLGYPVVLKAVADGLGHKSDIGGVRLGLDGPEAVREAHREVCADLHGRGLSGVATLVQPERHGGVELLVGVVRDPAWGLTMAVGLGGVWVEVLRDSALRLLPADPEEIRAALGELRGARLLEGARGTEPADLDRVAEVVARIGRLAEELGPGLESLEVNPLLVRGSEVEALDALVTWN